MITIENLHKIYRGADFELEALKGVSFHVSKGEFVAIMGESGSGKSTLLNCIGLMDKFDEGSYLLDGIEIQGKKKRELNEIRKNCISFIYYYLQ